MRFVLSMVLLASTLPAQSISFGVKAGVPLTSLMEGGSPGGYEPNSAAKRYTVGPVIELALPRSFAIEVGALYRRIGYDGLNYTTVLSRVRANSWEFPLLAKHYFGPRAAPLKVYALGGYVLREATNFDISYSFVNFAGPPVAVPDGLNYVHDNPVHGVAAGGGVRFRLGHIAISPEARYTRWNGTTFQQSGLHGYLVQSLRNQVDLLVGFTW